MEVEVVFALPDAQQAVTVRLSPGATVRDAVIASGLAFQREYQLGVFGKAVAPETPLADGDRVEIYRPLVNDPKEARRRRARGRR